MYKSPFDLDYDQPQCEGIMCEKRGNLLKLVQWNNPEQVNWFCEKCFQMSFRLNEEEKYRFLKYYKHPDTRAWLPPKALELYERLAKEAEDK